MKKYIVTIEEKDIRLGKHWTLEYCPIARAIKRATKIKEIRVYGDGELRLFSGRDERRIDLPVKICQFISKWDNFKTVKPTEFRLTI